MSILDEPARRPIGSRDERYLSILAEDFYDKEFSPQFIHVLVAQCGMPLKEPPPDKPYVRYNGRASLLLEPGHLLNPVSKKMEPQGLPFGSMARILMLDICTKATVARSPVIDMNECMSRYLAEDLLMHATGGARGSITSLKRQTRRLAATRLTLGMIVDKRAITFNPNPAIASYTMWHPDSEEERKYAGEVRLSSEFFETLLEHSIPVDRRAVRGLRSSPLGLDINFWMTHRLCRIPKARPMFLTYQQLHHQLAPDMLDTRKFKYKFDKLFKRVLSFYREANVSSAIQDGKVGIEFRHSPPPVKQKDLEFLKG